MPRDIEATINQLKELLPYVARDAKHYGSSTELVKKSYELHRATRLIDETLPYPSLASSAKGPFIRLQIGTKAVEAISLSKNPYDFIEASFEIVEPGEEYNILYRHNVATDVLNTRFRQPIYGQTRYFDLATIGQTIEDGGDLVPSELGSS